MKTFIVTTEWTRTEIREIEAENKLEAAMKVGYTRYNRGILIRSHNSIQDTIDVVEVE